MFRLVDVCRDVRTLNILARNGAMEQNKRGFYLIKNALMKHLYDRGLCVEAERSVQTFQCRACEGRRIISGSGGQRCWKCGGTGIYRKVQLFSLTFRVDGQRFRWHIPEDLVDWEIALNRDTSQIFMDPSTTVPPMTGGQIKRLLLRAWLGCRLQKVRGLPKLQSNWWRRIFFSWLHDAMGQVGDGFQKMGIGRVAGWFYLKRARIWRHAYG